MRVNGFGVIGYPALPSRSKHRSSHPNRRFKYTSCYVTCKDSYREAVHTCGIVRSRESGNVASGRSKRRLPAANGVLVRQTWGATCMSQWAMRAVVASGIATAIVETYRDLSAGVTGQAVCRRVVVANRLDRCETVHRHLPSPDEIAVPTPGPWHSPDEPVHRDDAYYARAGYDRIAVVLESSLYGRSGGNPLLSLGKKALIPVAPSATGSATSAKTFVEPTGCGSSSRLSGSGGTAWQTPVIEQW